MLNCPTCGVGLRPTARICIKCGHALTDEERALAGSQLNEHLQKNNPSSIDEVVGVSAIASNLEGPTFNEPVVDLPAQASPPQQFSSSVMRDQTAPVQAPLSVSRVKYLLAGAAAVGAIVLFTNIFPKIANVSPNSSSQVSSAPSQKSEPEIVVQNESLSLINISNIGRVVAMSESSQLLTNMLLNSTNAVRVIEIKSEIESLNIKPEKGDVRAARLLNERGLASFRQENYPEAVQFFYEAYKVNPADIEVMNNTAYALLKAGRYNDAEKWLGQVLTIAPGRTSAWANLADVYANTGRMDSSVAAFVVGFQFAQNREKALQFLRNVAESESSENLRASVQKALIVLGQ